VIDNVTSVTGCAFAHVVWAAVELAAGRMLTSDAVGGAQNGML
jgi:hypothetical protein